uniref:Uncharacterized protein n=1 Tax=Rhizophora mucronata TaxID=61149 RepID=A0A2P2Q5S9_RHIMU
MLLEKVLFVGEDRWSRKNKDCTATGGGLREFHKRTSSPLILCLF